MIKFYFGAGLCLLLTIATRAQIITPDTFCAGTTPTLTALDTATTYTWTTGAASVDPLLTPVATTFLSGPTFSDPLYMSFTKDGPNYYSFLGNGSTNQLLRLSYGTDPLSVPTVSVVGTYGTMGQAEGIEIVQEGGQWYGFHVNGYTMTRLDFGTSLSSAPTATTFSFTTSGLSWPHQIIMKRYNGEWIAFVANRNGYVSRFDFGPSLTSTPTVVDLPNVGGVANPCNMVLHEQGGEWYAIITSLISGTMSRYDFGTDLKNNAPAGTLLGGFGVLSLPRSVTLFKDCDELRGIVQNESGMCYKMNFGNDVTNTPTLTALGSTGVYGNNAFLPVLYNDTIYLYTVSFGASSVYRFPILGMPAGSTTKYYDPTYTPPTGSIGTLNMTLWMDQGYFSGTSVACEPVLAATNLPFLRDTTLCEGVLHVLNASPSAGTGYLWNTGDTTAAISVGTSGTYTVAITGSPCLSADTASVIFQPGYPVALRDDTAVCANVPVSLELGGSAAPGISYSWNTGATTSSIVATTPGIYVLTATPPGGCAGRDTVMIGGILPPKPALGPDVSLCEKDSLMLDGTTPGAASYAWNTGQTAAQITTTKGGQYTLRVTDTVGCTDADTVGVRYVPLPVSGLSPDTTLCSGQQLTLMASAGARGGEFLWSTGDTGYSILVQTRGAYSLTVTNECGTDEASTFVDVVPCTLFFPEAFTPNGDGLNDYAHAFGYLRSITQYQLRIYNRWGELVYSTIQPEAGWDGTYQGVPQAGNTFAYYITYTQAGKPGFLKGFINLIR